MAKNKSNKNVTIPLEKFVKQPQLFLEKLIKLLNTSFTKKTNSVLKNQKIPRTKIADSITLDVYKRCGWEHPKKLLSENEEMQIRREYALKNKVSYSSLRLLDKLSNDYNNKYLKNIIN